MKKWMSFLLASAMVLSLSACGMSEQASTPINSTHQKNDEQIAENHILITYFSVMETDGVDTVAGASRVATDSGVMGNVEFIAKEIQKNVGGDLIAINTVQEYPRTHQELLEFAHNEMMDEARPDLAEQIEDWDSYDVIFVGYPIWNADLPMPMYTFFDEYDFSGKTLIPFSVHGGSGLADTIQTIETLEPNANLITPSLSVSRTHVPEAQEDVKAWTDALPLH